MIGAPFLELDNVGPRLVREIFEPRREVVEIGVERCP